jgi:hypothetical protein
VMTSPVRISERWSDSLNRSAKDSDIDFPGPHSGVHLAELLKVLILLAALYAAFESCGLRLKPADQYAVKARMGVRRAGCLATSR